MSAVLSLSSVGPDNISIAKNQVIVTTTTEHARLDRIGLETRSSQLSRSRLGQREKYQRRDIGISWIEMDENDYYMRVQAAYDRIAPSYDAGIGKASVSHRAKQLALRTVKDLTPRGGLLLDIGCYTGIEALLLAQQGYRVVGVDLSPAMVQIAKAKAKKRRLQDQVNFEVLRASELNVLLERGYGPFDTAYSVYGTLNLEPRIEHFKSGVLALLRERGIFVCGLLNPTVLYELVVAPWLLKFHGYRKLAKTRVRTRVGPGADTVETFLYTPEDFAALMEPEFSLTRVRGLHVFYPPPRGTHGSHLWWIPRALDSLEVFVEERFPFSHLGFFTLLTFKRNGRKGQEPEMNGNRLEGRDSC